MKKHIKQTPKNEQMINVLKRLTTRIEDATVDIHSMKSDLKFVNLRLGQVERNTEIVKIDMEKMKGEMVGMKGEMQDMKVDIQGMRGDMEGLEVRLSKRITYVADLITIELGGKLQNHEKRIGKLEHAQQLA